MSSNVIGKVDELLDLVSKNRLNSNKNSNSCSSKRKRVLVSGCFDLLHSGHVAFLNEAATHGDLYVRIGSDDNIRLLKHHDPMFPQEERLYILRNLKAVYNAEVASGSGMLDFEPDILKIKPDIFFVNEDGDRQSKRNLAKKYNLKYVVAPRKPHGDLPIRSSTSIKASLKDKKKKSNKPTEDTKTVLQGLPKVEERKSNNYGEHSTGNDVPRLLPIDSMDYAFPWRLCLAGGWLDQRWVSEIYPGPVITINVEHNKAFKCRSGLGTSTRRCGLKLWGDLTVKNVKDEMSMSCVDAARMLFGAENPPGTEYVSGSQDALGLLLPGINSLHYNGNYWPSHITNIVDNTQIKAWLESVLYLLPLDARPNGYNPLKTIHKNKEHIKLIADASTLAWKSILNLDSVNLGKALNMTLKGWKALLPETVPDKFNTVLKFYQKTTHGCLFTGAGGGFLMIISDKPVKGTFKIKINNKPFFRNIGV